MKNFEEYLMQQCGCKEVMCYERWLEGKDTEDLILYADMFASIRVVEALKGVRDGVL